MATEKDRFLSAADIFAVEDLQILEVEVPEWKGVIRLRQMPADEAIRFQDAMKGPASKSAWVRILALCAVDADGARLFSDSDMEKLRKKSTAVFLRLQKLLLKHNGFTEDETTVGNE